MTISRRPEAAEDEPFLRCLILETISEQSQASAWPPPFREELLETQYQVLRQGIRNSASGSPGTIVLREDRPVGWYVAANRADEIFLVTIMVLAKHRKKGIGSAILQDLLEESDQSHKPLRLTVGVNNNSAVRLYETFGFQRLGGDEVNHLMERRPHAS
jgi:ribosomal protein S18 acetylase RimI-like enzyme